MKTKVSSTLWIYFAGTVFTIMLASGAIMAVIAGILLNNGYLDNFEGRPIFVIIILLIISSIIGMIISISVGKKIIAPITRLSNASQEVAKGNFDVTLQETHLVKEIRDMSGNFNLMVKELGSIETLRNDFVVNVSHEFKTPLAVIEGYATLLQDKSLSEAEHDEYIKMIIDSTRQLGTLSGNILKISKLENREIIVDQASFRLDEQIRQVMLILEPEWSKKELSINVELPKVIFHGNKELLMQVWMNLLGNAIKFTEEHGDIGVTLTEKSSYVVAEIYDTGIGMTQDVKNHIFEKFYQGDKSRSSGGNGLGLALTKRIVDLSGGSIHVESEPGNGSVFTVKLPKRAIEN